MKYISVVIFIVLVIFLVACNENSVSNKLENPIWPSNTEILDEYAPSYSIQDFKEYFGDNYSIFHAKKFFYIEEVDRQFPLRYFRNVSVENDIFNYAVFPVTEGGSYYLTFCTILSDSGESKYVVSECMYINPQMFTDNNALCNIVPNISSYHDVLASLPMTQLITTTSSGVFSYSLVNQDLIAVISYSHKESDYVVQNISYCPRKDSSCIFSYILDSDLMYGTGDGLREPG